MRTHSRVASVMEYHVQHGFFEGCVHSKTYAEIIKTLPLNAKEVFDDIMINENIVKRASDITDKFENTVIMNSKMILKTDDYSLEEHKKSIVMSIFALNILEAILFKSSFITSFAFKENGIMNSTGDAIKKIQLDEIGHYAMTNNIINRLNKDPEWIHIFSETYNDVREMYRKAIEADYQWIDYLFEENPILLGVSSDILKSYVDYNAKIVMSAAGIEPFLKDTFNPCNWAKKYQKSSNIQTAMKEKNSANYLLGKVNSDIPLSFWSEDEQ